MDYLLLLIVIFVPVGFIVKLSDVGDKMEREEELNPFENFIFNLALVLMEMVVRMFNFILKIGLPFTLCFIPLIMFLVAEVGVINSELIPIILIISFVISAMFVGVFNLILTRIKKDL